MSQALSYLIQNPIQVDNDVDDDEILYRRFKQPINKIDPKEKFAEISEKYLRGGFSLFRSKYCKDPAHSLWKILPDPDENGNCEYTQMEGEVASCPISSLPESYTCQESNTVVLLQLCHDPVICNCSHTVIKFVDVPTSKADKTDLKMFLGGLFKDTYNK